MCKYALDSSGSAQKPEAGPCKDNTEFRAYVAAERFLLTQQIWASQKSQFDKSSLFGRSTALELVWVF